jgi:uncharacterized alkaline shock family protein YloU
VPGETESSYSPEVITTYVWDAIKEIPGVADLHRNPLQVLGEKVHFERLGPVRLEREEEGYALEVHLVVAPDVTIPETAAAVEQAVRTYLKKTAGLELGRVAVCVDDIALDDSPEN